MKSRREFSRSMMILLALLVAGLLTPARAQQATEQKTTATAATTPPGAMDIWGAIALPTPIFVGTPKAILSTNLEPYIPNKKPAPLLVPKDAALISLKKDVTASDKEPVVGELTYLTDGEKAGTDGNFVEFGPGSQWAQLDLGEPRDVYAAVVWHLFQTACAYRDVVVRCADDPDFTAGVKTLYNNDHDNSSGLGIGKDREYVETNFGRAINFMGEGSQPTRTRYIRLYSNGSTNNEMNHYTEVEVWGKPAK